MSAPATKRLTRALDEIRHRERYPYGLFVPAALRSFGLMVDETEAPEAVREPIAEAVDAYRAAVLEEEPFLDILGPVYQEENSHGNRDMSGQFFTPWELCRLMAGMNVANTWRPGPSPSGGLWRLHEPACGSGGMLLAVCAELIGRYRPEALLLWDIDAVDLDLVCARTCALQLLANLMLRGWSVGRLVVRHGNSLSLQQFGTVLHATNGPDPEELPRMWAELAPLVEMAGIIGRVRALVDEALPITEPPAPVEAGGQFVLFGEEAA